LLSTLLPPAGPDGDRLADTTFVQRTATTGGLGPDAATCNATTEGPVAEVPMKPFLTLVPEGLRVDYDRQ
jgi:hypothetical protein